MNNYLALLDDVLNYGVEKDNRTGIHTFSTFGNMLEFDLDDGFPAVTTKRLAFKQVKAELLWFISGSSDIRDLHKNDCRIWDANVKSFSKKKCNENVYDAGRVYGVQWRNWECPDGSRIDQLHEAIEKIRNESNDRRIIVSAWNPADLDNVCLPPCHIMFQFYVEKNYLSMAWYQRSVDCFLGLPFNIASYALLLSMVAHITNKRPGRLKAFLGDTHIYVNHIEQVKRQLSRIVYKKPKLILNPQVKEINRFRIDDITLLDYNYHPSIKGEMAV